MATLRSFTLKHPGGCSGMFWRANPITKKSGNGLPDWPRNGAVLRGYVHTLKDKVEGNTEWLEIVEYKQAGSSAFKPVPADAWMIFDQDGKLLHEVLH